MTALAMTLPAALGVSLDEVALALAPWGARVLGNASVRVAGVRQDSRTVVPGDLFAARSGKRASGADFAVEAVRRGAAAVLAEPGALTAPLGVPVVEVSDVRAALGRAAELVYGSPSRALALVGITGTNGKTTTSLLLEHALTVLGARPARLGTLGYSFGGVAEEGALTTPEADEVSRRLASALGHGASHFVMEVSSHALSLARVDALHFRVAAFTNLTQDHLDFYPSMAAYGAAKERLFSELSPEISVIAVDDEFGRGLAARAQGRVLTTGRAPEASVHPLTFTTDGHGVRAEVATPRGSVSLVSALVGEHNLENLLLALGVLLALGFEPGPAASALGSAPAVPGRLERCDRDDDDVRVLAATARITAGQVVCVFGCGGDRDPDKRPKMGAAVAQGAARAVLTSDNPRSEDPAVIAAAVEAGLRDGRATYEVVLDRAQAIEKAVLEARPGDSVLIAGKGHEPYQIIGVEKRPFDDRVEARRALQRRRARRQP
ncbi:MAG TPA: UDP-N-acetylmuramoyl-L-alanyl-D-glutamate--2,6-diaminopimelate ligase [Polyangiaceae bacterium]|nr:UDP-N-acetylmuramoyl-L-alanyl-D-glutamate--2,6-diaminopimelate ligase [Polyangiaceae bacterium]